MRFALDYLPHRPGAGVPDLPPPADQPLWRPFQVFCVGFGHMCPVGGRPALHVTSPVGRHPLFPNEYLHRPIGQPDIHLLMYEPVRDAVEVVVDLDVVINVHLGLEPRRKLVTLLRQGQQYQLLDLLVKAQPAPFHLLKWAAVELYQQLFDGLVQFLHAEKGEVAQRRQDPAFGVEHRVFRLGLVPGLIGPGGNDHGAVVLGHLQVGRVQVRLIPAGFGNARFGVVWNRDLRHSLKVLVGVAMGSDPVRELLVGESLAERVTARPQDGDKEAGRPEFPGQGINNGDGRAGPVDKNLLAGLVGQPHSGVEGLPPAAVILAELRVLIPVGICLPVLLPQQLQRHTLLPQLPLDIIHIGQGALRSR